MGQAKERGLHIAFGGIDGSGKGTQVELLLARLRELGIEAVGVSEPGTTPLGEEIRNIVKFRNRFGHLSALAELLLFFAAREDLYSKIIIPERNAGVTVVSDRFFLCSVAYQICGGSREDLHSLYRRLCSETVPFQPDLAIVLDVGVDVGRRRAAARSEERRAHFEELGDEFFEQVRRGYRQEVERLEHGVVINGNGTPEAVHAEVWQALLPLIRGRLSEPASPSG